MINTKRLGTLIWSVMINIECEIWDCLSSFPASVVSSLQSVVFSVYTGLTSFRSQSAAPSLLVWPQSDQVAATEWPQLLQQNDKESIPPGAECRVLAGRLWGEDVLGGVQCRGRGRPEGRHPRLQEEVNLPGQPGLQVWGQAGPALHRLQGQHRQAQRGLGEPRDQGHDPVHSLGLLGGAALGRHGDWGLSLPWGWCGLWEQHGRYQSELTASVLISYLRRPGPATSTFLFTLRPCILQVRSKSSSSIGHYYKMT